MFQALAKRGQDVPRRIDALLRRDGSTASVSSFGSEKVEALSCAPT